ncbi:Tim44-like domain protein [Maioricimonas rarisocia]|uniref:Tim44-like domain protein n=1 Tax=Maioricimonas rarisocia TaxID=2528026 RepID=A0A517Z2V1_9PLAN|nr:TIM44-like domain-containing protein [Maioricimonas rarisocia]QDU36830.1 Tim44-like domain protein [Maioricimonas rarisocia]
MPLDLRALFRRPGLLNRRLWWTALAAVALLSACLIWPDSVFARAGGGGGFGGGGGGGGGGGSGGSGGGDGIAFLIWLCVHHPLIGFPLVAGIIVLMVYSGNSAKEGHVTRTIRRGRQIQDRMNRQAALQAIQARDPGFDEQAFLGRVTRAFVQIQHAWSEQNMLPARAFISDGIHERFSLQLDMQKAEGFRNLMENVQVRDASIAAVHSTDAFDTIHVRIRASAVDYNVDLETGRRKDGSTSASEFVEFWSFHRRPGAKSLEAEGAIEGRCPRCGSPLQIVDQAKCDACGAQVNSGEFDWVLAEITQDQEWIVPGAEAAVPGFAELQQRDPALNVQHLEDRASVMFWRLRAAEFQRDLEPARPILTPEYRDRWSNELEQMQRRSEFWKIPAVGKVELIDAQPGEAGAPDRIRIKVRWSGILSKGDPTGRSREVRRKTIYTSVYTLVRKVGVQSVPSETFSSAGCSSCGAPIDVNEQGCCEFCGANLVSGQYDWVLDDVSPYTSDMAFRPAINESFQQAVADARGSRPATPPPLESFEDVGLSLATLARVIAIDGISEKEREAFHRLASHRGMSGGQADAYLSAAGESDAGIPVPQDGRQAREFLEQLVHIVLVDGQLSRRERKLLDRYAERVDLVAADVKMAISKERRRAYQQARRQIRASKQVSG